MNNTTLLALWIDRERADRLGATRELPDLLAAGPVRRRGRSDGRWRGLVGRPSNG